MRDKEKRITKAIMLVHVKKSKKLLNTKDFTNKVEIAIPDRNTSQQYLLLKISTIFIQ